MRETLMMAAMAAALLGHAAEPAVTDTLTSGLSSPLVWEAGVEAYGGGVPSTNGYLGGENPQGEKIGSSAGVELKAGFSYGADTREGRLYKGLYQGLGAGIGTYMPGDMLGNPATVYVYQGAPVARLGRSLSLDYEWQFGMAAGWRHTHDLDDVKAVTSTSFTALMGIGLKLQWAVSDRVRLRAGVEARHYSNGNTSFPNAGVNMIGGSVGVSYVLTAPRRQTAGRATAIVAEAPRWVWDFMAYGAWRKRVVYTGDIQQVCPGRFAVAGVQVSPLRQLNQWVAVGPSLDVQWDESASLADYWVTGTYDDDIRFYRPPLGKQIKVGVSAHAELTTPIFHVNAGIGYDFVNPKGDKRFYQSLSLKTFVTRSIYLNVGYRLGEFSTPQNLMLGVGYRL